jgi:OPA family sugar phosphate sensor protein UhpC-like MFS transporter
MNQPLQKNKTCEYRRYRIFGITWLGYPGFYLTRSSFSVAKIDPGEHPDIMMSSEQMGLIDVLYLTAYAIGQFVWSMLRNKVGTRIIVLFGLL